MKRLFIFVLMITIWSAPAWAVSNPDGVAVIIGNKTYQGHIPSVEYADNDAEAIKRYVIDVLGFREGNIIDLRDATQGQFLSVFGNESTHEGKVWQYVKSGKSDVVVFYSGHGVPGQKDKRGYLLPVDADPNTPEINGYSIDLLYRNLSRIKARTTTVFLDTCFSGDSNGGMLIGSASPISIVARMPLLAKGMTVITAAHGDQLASWDNTARHGLFTEYLLQSLYGKADGNGDGKVTVKEIGSYLDEKMTYAARRRFNRHQQATVMGNTDRVLASYTPGKPPPRPKIEVAGKTPVNAPDANDKELAFWDAVKDSTDPAEFEAYLSRHPNGELAPLAKARLKALKNKQVAVVIPSPPPSYPSPPPFVRELRVTVRARKSTGLGWDPLGAPPDIAICVYGIGNSAGRRDCYPRQFNKGHVPQCRDAFECAFPGVVIPGEKYGIAVFDVDIMRDDLIGRGVCETNRRCLVGQASVTIVRSEPAPSSYRSRRPPPPSLRPQLRRILRPRTVLKKLLRQM